MGVFSAFHSARNMVSQAGGVAGVRRMASDHVDKSKQDWEHLHGNMPGAVGYIQSAAGRATVRHAAGSALHRFIGDSSKKHFRKGNYLKGALYSFAHMALQTQMDALRNDQRIFTNIAKVRRGDPEVAHLTHNQLREVTDHAARYGGQDAAHIAEAAHGELTRRQVRKNTEWDTGEAHRDELRRKRRTTFSAAEAQVHAARRLETNKLLHEQSLGHEEELAKKKAEHIAMLRTESGHTAQARIAAKQQHLELRKKAEEVKTKGVKDRQGAVQKTLAAKAKIIKMTATGAVVRSAKGTTYTVGKERAQAMQRGGSRMRKSPTGTRGRRSV